LLVSTLRDVVVVPDTAVQRGPNGLYAYVVTKESKAEVRKLKVTRIEGGNALVEQGLSPGDGIVISGHYRVQPGGQLQALLSAQTPTIRKFDRRSPYRSVAIHPENLAEVYIAARHRSHYDGEIL
jgi:hypothetical protein